MIIPKIQHIINGNTEKTKEKPTKMTQRPQMILGPPCPPATGACPSNSCRLFSFVLRYFTFLLTFTMLHAP
jgi:hypothetical protein